MNKSRDTLTLPDAVGVAVATEVRRYGSLGVETGGFLVAPENDPMGVTVVAMAGERGVTRRRGLFHVIGDAIDRLFAWCDSQYLRIPAQFHSHGQDAFLSDTDRRDGFNVIGFISAVVPHFANPPADTSEWRWWVFSGDDWTGLSPPATCWSRLRVVVFDEDGVRDH